MKWEDSLFGSKKYLRQCEYSIGILLGNLPLKAVTMQMLKSDVTEICVNIVSQKWNGTKAGETSELNRRSFGLWQSS